MPTVVQFTEPGTVELVPCEPQVLPPGHVRVRTLYSGISAGTELTAYRGTNPYLERHWDADRRIFTDGAATHAYPLTGWGYSEVGEVVEVAADVTSPAVGEVVYGIWGHRSEGVLPAAAVAGRRMPDGTDPITGVFARVGSIALNAVLAARTVLGDRVAVFGQGVIGLLTTRLATSSGARVIAVDPIAQRLDLARRMGAMHTVPADVAGGAGLAIRELTPAGADAAIEISGNDRALAEAIRSVGADGLVVASGFYQGPAAAVRLGEEFHHNRVRIVASQIGGTPLDLGPRWDQQRLNHVVMEEVAAGTLDVAPLISHVLPAGAVAEAFGLLDTDAGSALQVVLDFRDAA